MSKPRAHPGNRTATSLVEAALFVCLALALFVTVMGLIRTTRAQDEFNAERLDVVSQLTTSLERLRRDAWASRGGTVQRDANGLTLEAYSRTNPAAVEAVPYRWDSRTGNLERSGERVGAMRLDGFAASGGPGLITVGLLSGTGKARALGGQTPCSQLVVPVFFRERATRLRFAEWVPDRGEPGRASGASL